MHSALFFEEPWSGDTSLCPVHQEAQGQLVWSLWMNGIMWFSRMCCLGIALPGNSCLKSVMYVFIWFWMARISVLQILCLKFHCVLRQRHGLDYQKLVFVCFAFAKVSGLLVNSRVCLTMLSGLWIHVFVNICCSDYLQMSGWSNSGV